MKIADGACLRIARRVGIDAFKIDADSWLLTGEISLCSDTGSGKVPRVLDASMAPTMSLWV